MFRQRPIDANPPQPSSRAIRASRRVVAGPPLCIPHAAYVTRSCVSELDDYLQPATIGTTATSDGSGTSALVRVFASGALAAYFRLDVGRRHHKDGDRTVCRCTPCLRRGSVFYLHFAAASNIGAEYDLLVRASARTRVM